MTADTKSQQNDKLFLQAVNDFLQIEVDLADTQMKLPLRFYLQTDTETNNRRKDSGEQKSLFQHPQHGNQGN